ncbi:uncharacterized protein HMPREF1541_07963 [Cyphellophora europaea CBS 101466]|uniref:UBC core domain-containing protein n=1 Tax=Cyphellophora europaea (strain CBS 101466) TaxID=1220924 RepID=W2RKY0_CYPE1|nr:uncharacterized protein HMPREF1541_07963 [Cyphellophora europaea CBS 101466]ETN36975.1 hypothetical protein HMPREF1541_07963 [Cyphellophora europaea CBS 101466]
MKGHALPSPFHPPSATTDPPTQYRLSFIFGPQYPIEAPEVSFIKVAPSSTPQQQHQPPSNTASNPIDLTSDSQPPAPPPATPDNGARPIPIHPHIYTNGIICLDLLGSAGWSPVQSVESVCMSIQSMLTGNTKNVRPEGDDAFCQSMGVRGPNGWSSSSGGRGWGGGGGRGLRDVRFAYDDDTV